ncbi:hypothetical protein FisN_3Hu039 [Fistulifera solaris]|jgi:hypothetical protein|uniref:Uncharacterized protein n=1 Tax=Fistulifera solaris TaxID=1519565 RepID=A0A1Z5JNH3_FISSO|nr:hypothetical protein FisN_3Hu039 [Fistulifera solaris]|eukprot:GAX15570.1 hypothetical protein FisN_3Hu039 [Fistulifera solaris]
MNVAVAIEANNAAVSCICQGQLDEARVLLVGSIRSMKDQLNVDAGDATAELLKQPNQMPSAVLSLQSVSVFSLASYDAFQKRNIESSSLSLFDRVYRIRSPCADNQSLISAIILYNMAMVFHLEILLGKCHQLEKVEQLYLMCDVIAQQSKLTCSQASLLTLAALNNTAHLSSMYLMTRETGHALDDLISELAFLNRDNTIMDDDLLIFQMNAFLHSTGQGFRTAPSA